MNLTRMRQLRAHIAEQHDELFTMSDYLSYRWEGDTCQTIGCIAGHCLLMLHPGKTEWQIRNSIDSTIRQAATDALGLSDWEATNLFEPTILEKRYEEVTRQDALAVLDLVIEERKVSHDSWARALAP